MTQKQFLKHIKNLPSPKTFQAINFGCRVNAAETNQLSQVLVNHGFTPNDKNPKTILINTCAVTQKGQKESISKVKSLSQKYPQATIVVTGCASFEKIKNLPQVHIFNNKTKQIILKNQNSYTKKIGDKYSSSRRYILKIQSGCNHFCSYCIVPFRRPRLWSLTIDQAIQTVNLALKNGYQEIIITGTNLNLYNPRFSRLVKSLLTHTSVPLISFGSIPLNCINSQFINLYKNKKYSNRLNHFLHLPIQSGSNKILRFMNRPYTRRQILKTIEACKSKIKNLKLGTDIIVGFPGESKKEFQQTMSLCHQIGFTKIHVFRYSPRPGTKAKLLFDRLAKIKNSEKHRRSQLIAQTILPSRQTPADSMTPFVPQIWPFYPRCKPN